VTEAYAIRAEHSRDTNDIAALHRAAFGEDDPVPALVEGLRRVAAPLPTLSFVAVDPTGRIIGHVMLSHGWLDAPDRLVDVLVLSPLAVLPEAQRRGVGTALLAHAVAEAGRTAAPLLCLEGSPTYYGKRGFEPAHLYDIGAPSRRIPRAALQIVRLAAFDPAMTGTIVYRDVFWEHDCVGLR